MADPRNDFQIGGRALCNPQCPGVGSGVDSGVKISGISQYHRDHGRTAEICQIQSRITIPKT